MIRRPPRSTQSRSSAASDVYKRQAGGPLLFPHATLPGPSGHPLRKCCRCDSRRSDSAAWLALGRDGQEPVSYTHLRAHETDSYLVCRLLLEKKKKNNKIN